MRWNVWSLAAIMLAVSSCGDAPSEPLLAQEPTTEDLAVTKPAVADPDTTITCAFPVTPQDTAQTILDRFGEDARMETLENEGGLYPVVALWPDDPNKRVEIAFADDAMSAVASLRIAGEAPQWNIAGIARGTKLAELEQRNGGPFELYGFEWDYGGRVFDWHGGSLAALEGGCELEVFVGNMDDSGSILPDELVGDRAVRSDLASLRALDVEVFDLSIIYPR